MKKDDIKRLSERYPHMWSTHLSMQPDGWSAVIEKLLGALDLLNDDGGQEQWVSVLVHRYASGQVKVFVSPVISCGRWAPAQAYHVLAVVDGINDELAMTCEVCGSMSATLHKSQLGVGSNRIVCEEHKHVD
ncbi:hypothetical protein [Rhizobium giardinii]|uniref:hypothetical protein n=1 Tax=Rhizobium giardinii TaxID=56731 RepID=UPI003D6DF1BF